MTMCMIINSLIKHSSEMNPDCFHETVEVTQRLQISDKMNFVYSLALVQQQQQTPGAAASLQMQILRPRPRPTESESIL